MANAFSYYLGGDPNAVPKIKQFEEFYKARRDYSFASKPILDQQTPIAQIQQNITASDRPLPIVYGAAQVGGRMFVYDYDSGTQTWTIGYLLCLGEIEEVTNVWLDDAAAVSGVTVQTHVGSTSQTADSLLVAAISGYADTCVLSPPAGDIGVAYVVIQYVEGTHYDTWPRVVADVKGLKCYRGAAAVDEVWMKNPTAAIGYFPDVTATGEFTLTVYGIRQDSSAGDYQILVGEDNGSNNGVRLYNSTGTNANRITIVIDGTTWDIDGAFSPVSLGDFYGWELIRYSGGGVFFRILGQSGATHPSTMTGDFIFNQAHNLNVGDGAFLYRITFDDNTNIHQWDINTGRGSYIASNISNAYEGYWSDPGGWVYNAAELTYSDNFSDFLRDMIYNPIYGLGQRYDKASFDAVRAIGESSQTWGKAHIGGIVLDQTQTPQYVIEILRTYARCFAYMVGDTWYAQWQVPELAPATGVADMVEGSFSVTLRSRENSPTVIRVLYTDTSGNEWRQVSSLPEKLAGVDTGDLPYVESIISMPGITRAGEAENYAELRLSDLSQAFTCQWQTYDEHQTLSPGQATLLTHPYIGTEYVRIMEVTQMSRAGFWEVRAEHYSQYTPE